MNKKILKHVIRYALMICIIIVCYVIFGFSDQQGQESSSISTIVSRKIVSAFFKNLSENEFEFKVELIHPFIRKLAHFSIYMLLGILLMCCSQTYERKNKKKIFSDFMFSFIYACSDELHQHFISGRNGNIIDVGIDTCGATFGILITLLVFVIITNANKNKVKKNQSLHKKDVVFIASTGGHLSELLQLKPIFNNYNYNIITEKNKVDKSLKKEYGKRLHFLIYGTRKHPFIYFFKALLNLFINIFYYFKFHPDVIVTTGTHTAVIMCYIGKLFGSKIIYIETFANQNTKTLAGKLVYPIADTFVVQWKNMQVLYPKAICWGWIY